MKKQKFYILSIFFSLFLYQNLFSQVDLDLVSNYYNRSIYNPASITGSEYIYLFTNARLQWKDIVGAPRTFNAEVYGYSDKFNSALGLSLMSDQLGFVKFMNPKLTYAYQISNDRENWTLSMGISGGIYSRFIDRSLYDPVEIEDPALFYNFENIIRPDVNIGFEFESEHFIAGLSTTHLFSILKSKMLLFNTNHRYGYVIYRNSYLEMLNYDIGLRCINHQNFIIMELKGDVHFKHSTGSNYGIREMLDVGFSYQTSKQLSAMFGINISPSFKVGYVFNKSFLPGYSQNNTNEFLLICRFPVKSNSLSNKFLEDGDWGI